MALLVQRQRDRGSMRWCCVQEPDPEEYPMDRSATLFRLFVAWVPKLFTEHDLRSLFAQVGASGSGQGRSSGAGRPPDHQAQQQAPCMDFAATQMQRHQPQLAV
jgi:hypothetical protein